MDAAEQEEAVLLDVERTPLLATRPRDGVSETSDRHSPWWKTPSPYWLVPGVVFMSMSMGSITPPKMEIINMLACRAVLSTGPTSAVIVESPIDTPWLLLGTKLDMNTCHRDPTVQRAVTELNVGLTLIMGILSALTAGYWGSLSDRKGRRPIICLTQFGFLCTDLVFLMVVTFNRVLPYRLLFLGPLLDGLLGGFATALACFGAYISDCTPQGSRANVFGFLTAIIFAGFAIGPTFGAIVIDITGSVLAPFYISAVLHAVHVLAIALVVPESRSQAMMDAAQARYEQEVKAASSAGRPSFWGRTKKVASSVILPLTVFLPQRVDQIQPDQKAILRPIKRRSWALTLVGIAYAFAATSMAIYPVKMQYSQYRFGWGPQENGYLLTMAGVSRCIVLLIILPLFTKIFRTSPASSSADKNKNGTNTGTAETIDHTALRARLLHDSHFDLVLGRGSFLFDLIGYGVIVFTTTPFGFILGSALASFGVGGGPALQSLALTLSSPDDSGKVLAALSVLQSVLGQIVGPVIFNAAFALTLKMYAPAVFAIVCAVFAAGLMALACVRLAKRTDFTRRLDDTH